jgi:hypothetical protein
VFDQAIKERNEARLSLALEIAHRTKRTATKDEWPAILNDVKLPLYTRIQSAVLLAANNDRQSVDLIRNTILNEAKAGDENAQFFALTHAHKIFGDEAAALVCNHVRKCRKVGTGAWTAMLKISGEKAVPELRKMIAPEESVESQLFALACLGPNRRGAKALVPDLIRILKDDDRTAEFGWSKPSTHRAAVQLLGDLGLDAEPALPLLIERAKKSAPDEYMRVLPGKPKMGTAKSRQRFADDDYVDAICRIWAGDVRFIEPR